MRARLFDPSDADVWDRLCAESYAATFLHTRRFLSYHGARFADCSVVIERGGRVVGVMPAAKSQEQSDIVVSHPGASYGGIIHRGELRGEPMVEALAEVRRVLASIGFRRLHYKAVPTIYHRTPAQDDLYALHRLSARRFRCDLSTCIDLKARLPVAERRRRALKKATKASVVVVTGREHAGGLWRVLEDNLERKHGVKPTHSLDEILLLADWFTRDIEFVVALQQDEIVAGTVLFHGGATVHAQYIASSTKGHVICALDAVFDYCIAKADAEGARYFDFGVSTEVGGTVLNDGLYRFKSEFGGSGAVHEFYELSL